MRAYALTGKVVRYADERIASERRASEAANREKNMSPTERVFHERNASLEANRARNAASTRGGGPELQADELKFDPEAPGPKPSLEERIFAERRLSEARNRMRNAPQVRLLESLYDLGS